MATANEEIRDGLVRHQTQLIRASANVGRNMARLLGQVDQDIRRILERIDIVQGTRPRFGKTRQARLQDIQAAIRDVQRPAYNVIRRQLRENAIELGVNEIAFTSNLITGALPVTVSLALPTSALVRAIAVSKPFEGRVLRRWVSQLETTDTNRMMDQIRIGMTQGESSQQITRRVFGTAQQGFDDGTRNLTKANIAGITRTAVNFITNESRQELYKANRKLIPKELYVATLDGRTTVICMGLDGKLFDVGVGPTPPVHFNCRSLRVPVINGKVAGVRPASATTREMLKGLSRTAKRNTVNRLTGQVPASENYATFLRKQPVAFQNDVLGKTKASLFRKGGLELDEFTDPKGKTLTIAQLKRQNPSAFTQAGLQNDS